jgi:ankyrin repeat protein
MSSNPLLLNHTMEGIVSLEEINKATKDELEQHDEHGITLLYYACVQCNSDIVEAILEKNVNVNVGVISARPIVGATCWGKWSNAELLLQKGANPNVRAAFDCTPLYFAARHGAPTSTIQALINAGADITAKDTNGKTPLAIARENFHHEIVQCIEQYSSQTKSANFIA